MFGERPRFANFIRSGRSEILRIYVETHYHDDVTRKHSIRSRGKREGRTENDRERERERERENSSNQIHGDSSGHACRSGCTTLYRRLSSPPLDPSLFYVPTPSHESSLSLSLSLSFSRLDAARPLTALLHLIGPRVLTRRLTDTFNDIHARAFRPVPRRHGGR